MFTSNSIFLEHIKKYICSFDETVCDRITIIKNNSKRYELTKQETFIYQFLDKEKIKFKCQPNGTQRAPDFLINDQIKLECKSSNSKYTIIMNDGIIEKDTYYFVNTKEHIYFFQGIDYIGNDKYDDYVKWNFEFKKACKELNKQFQGIGSQFGHCNYARNMGSLDLSLDKIKKFILKNKNEICK